MSGTVLEQIEAALAEVRALCKGKRWQMTIPVDERHDSDVIISRALVAARAALPGAAPESEPGPTPGGPVEKLRAALRPLAEQDCESWGCIHEPDMRDERTCAPERARRALAALGEPRGTAE